MPIVVRVGHPVIHCKNVRRCFVLWACSLPLLWGCFSEKSYPLVQHEIIALDPPQEARESARHWLQYAHGELEHLLPARRPTAMLTEDLSIANGQPAAVDDHFEMRFDDMDTLLGNFDGLLHTAQLASTQLHLGDLPPWPEFEDVWIPVGESLELAGRLGFATDDVGRQISADCIVLLPGLYGDNGVQRTKDLASALRGNGFHVLALELRSCGQTERRYPLQTTTFGILETGDLLLVSEWVENLPGVERSGLIGFCWGGNIALLTAWADGDEDDDPGVAVELKRYMQEIKDQLHYTAGVLVFSPALAFEDLIEQLDHPHSMLLEPVLATFQETMRLRQRTKGYHPANGSLRDLVGQELANYDFGVPDSFEFGMRCSQLIPHDSGPVYDKLGSIRVPTLIVMAANDPLIPAQGLANLMTPATNPNVAAMILPGGGHVGFAAYARAYYFNLILNFFDRRSGPKAATPN